MGNIQLGPSLGTTPQRAVPTDLISAQAYVGAILNDLANGGQFQRNTQLTGQQWRQQVISNSQALLSSVNKLLGANTPNGFDRAQMEARAAEIAANLAQLVSAARNAACEINHFLY